MNFVDSLNILGIEAKQNPSIKGSGTPTTETAGAVGCLYMDTDNGKLYKCTSTESGSFAWEEISSGGAAGVDSIVSQGKKDGWIYRQWASGFAECWTKIENLKENAEVDTLAFPFPIKSPMLNTSYETILPVCFTNEVIFCPVYIHSYNPYINTAASETTEYIESITYGVGCLNTNHDVIDVPSSASLKVHVIGKWKDIISGDTDLPLWEGGLY